MVLREITPNIQPMISRASLINFAFFHFADATAAQLISVRIDQAYLLRPDLNPMLGELIRFLARITARSIWPL
jgi:hypothetical protein